MRKKGRRISRILRGEERSNVEVFSTRCDNVGSRNLVSCVGKTSLSFFFFTAFVFCHTCRSNNHFRDGHCLMLSRVWEAWRCGTRNRSSRVTFTAHRVWYRRTRRNKNTTLFCHVLNNLSIFFSSTYDDNAEVLMYSKRPSLRSSSSYSAPFRITRSSERRWVYISRPLRPKSNRKFSIFSRTFYATQSCTKCGKKSLLSTGPFSPSRSKSILLPRVFGTVYSGRRAATYRQKGTVACMCIWLNAQN